MGDGVCLIRFNQPGMEMSVKELIHSQAKKEMEHFIQTNLEHYNLGDSLSERPENCSKEVKVVASLDVTLEKRVHAIKHTSW